MGLVTSLERLARGRTCIVGMGNTIRRDDAVGVYIAERVRGGAVSGGVTVVNAEDVIENYVWQIAGGDAENVIIIDAVRSGAEAGSVLFGRLHEFDELIGNHSTHKLALRLSGRVIEERDKKAWLLGIEVLDTDYGTGLTDRVKKSADMISDLLLRYFNSEQKEPRYEH